MKSIPLPWDSGFTTSTPVPLYWARYGAAGGTPLLVLHGGPGADHRYLLPQMLALANDERDLVLYDQRGGGQSKTEDRTPITWQTQVQDLAAVIAELGGTPLQIAGYSWGGLLAMLYAIEAAAGRVRETPLRMVLVDPAPITRAFRDEFEAEFNRRQSGVEIQRLRDDVVASGLRERDSNAYRQRAFELSVAGYFANVSNVHDLTPFRVVGRVQQSIWDSLGDFDLTRPGMLDSVRASALIIHGRQDPIPLDSARAAATAMGARLVILEDCGHVPYVEQPARLFDAIDLFLGSGDPPGG